jgi:hypothetical protein
MLRRSARLMKTVLGTDNSREDTPVKEIGLRAEVACISEH